MMKQPNSLSGTEQVLRETASQTAGPYVHIGLALEVAGLPERDEEIGNVLAKDNAGGEAIFVTGRIYDGNGELVRDALIEVWQADHQGNYQLAYDQTKPFNSFGRTATSAIGGGEWTLDTVKPGTVTHPNGKPMAPHLNLSILARGVNVHLQTRLYFDDEADANAACPVQNSIESPARRETLIAQKQPAAHEGKPHYHLDIVLQGEGETVFFDF